MRPSRVRPLVASLCKHTVAMLLLAMLRTAEPSSCLCSRHAAPFELHPVTAHAHILPVLRVSGGREEEEAEEEVNEEVLPKEACLSRDQIMEQSALRIINMGRKAKQRAAESMAKDQVSMGLARTLLDIRDAREGGGGGSVEKLIRMFELIIGADWQLIKDENEFMCMLGAWEDGILSQEEVGAMCRQVETEEIDVAGMVEKCLPGEREMWEWLDGVMSILKGRL
eukprot:620774-Hanusia_phi.AAC.1